MYVTIKCWRTLCHPLIGWHFSPATNHQFIFLLITYWDSNSNFNGHRRQVSFYNLLPVVEELVNTTHLRRAYCEAMASGDQGSDPPRSTSSARGSDGSSFTISEFCTHWSTHDTYSHSTFGHYLVGFHKDMSCLSKYYLKSPSALSTYVQLFVHAHPRHLVNS